MDCGAVWHGVEQKIEQRSMSDPSEVMGGSDLRCLQPQSQFQQQQQQQQQQHHFKVPIREEVSSYSRSRELEIAFEPILEVQRFPIPIRYMDLLEGAPPNPLEKIPPSPGPPGPDLKIGTTPPIFLVYCAVKIKEMFILKALSNEIGPNQEFI
jgi:hypothetical protein